MLRIFFTFSLLIGLFLNGFSNTNPSIIYYDLCLDNGADMVKVSFEINSPIGFQPITIESDNCSTAVPLATDGSVTDVGTNIGSTEEAGEGIPSGLTSPISSVWYEITTTAPNTSVIIELNLGTMVDPAIAIWENTCFSALPPFVDFDASAGGVLPAVCLPPGTYLLQLATDAGNEGTYDINILSNTSASPLNEDCAGAFNNPLAIGVNTVDNNCAIDGLVWFEYTIVTGDHITVTPTGSFVVNNILLDDCSTPVSNTTCLKPGDVVHIEAGDPTPAFGTFDLDIVESDNPVINDDCTDAFSSSLGTLNCSNSFNGNGDNTACDDSEATCNPGVQGVWYYFNVNAQVTAFDITGTSFEVFTGSCGALTSLGCNGSAALSGIDITATGSDYYVLVYDDGTTSGSFTAIANPQTPSNDICSNAEVLSDATGMTGTTACASAPAIAFCNVTTTNDHAVWFEYTTPDNGLTTNITFTYGGSGASAASDLGIAVYDGCGGAQLLTDCSGTGVLNCAYPNTTYIIAVGSQDGSEGEFTITATEDNSALLSNDLCSLPSDITPANDCEWTTISDDITAACVEQFNGACNQINTPTVWYTITLPANALGLDFRMFVGSPSIQLFDNDCNDPAVGPSPVSGCISADGFQSLAPLPGTYLMSVSASGSFDFDFRIKVPPTNDMCVNAEELNLASLTSGTTECATFITEDAASCDGSPENLVWYYYNVLSDTKTLTLNITNFSSGGSINVAAWDGCNSSTYYNNDANLEACGSSISLDIDCPIAGTTIYFAVSSTQLEEGTFDIEIIESQVIVPANDDCNAATLANGPNCVIYQTPAGDNEFACPESFDIGGCGFDTEEVVWYEIELPSDAVTIDIGINNYGGSGTGFFSVFTDCSGSSIDGSCYTDISNGDPINNGVNIDVTSVAGNSIFIAFGSQGDTGGTHSLDVQINNTPTNDDPCTPDIFSAGGGTIAGNNECSTMDYDDPACSVQYENSVWYEYTLGAGETGVQVEVIANTAAGPFGVSIVDQAGNCNGSATAFTNASSCVGETEIVQAACLPAGQVIHIVVATANADAGTFDITLTPIVPMPSCIDNDDCANAQDLGQLITDAGCTIESDCNAGACPDIIGTCNGGLEVNNVVWYTVQNDGMGDFISVEITGATFDAPVVAVFVAPDCGSLSQIGPCFTGSGGGTASGPIDIDPNNPPIAGENYYIAVGSNGAIGGDFDLCIEIIGGCVNDDPCDAVELMDGVLVNSPASTVNCTPDEVNTSCPTAELNTVWYKFTMPAGLSTVRIEVNNISIVGDYGMLVGEYVSGTPACQTQNPPIFEGGCYTGARFIEELFCLKENTEYYIQIGSSDGMNAGDFDIQVDFSPGLVSNDLCQEAVDDASYHIDITMDDYCKFTGLMGTTVDACPDDIMSGACDYTMSPTVWFQVNIPNDPAITLMDALLTDIGQGAGQFTIFDGPCSALTPLAGAECGNAGTIINNLAITPGANYLVAVTTGNDTPGDFEFEVKVLAPPANDLCENAISLSVGSSTTGTTECATFSNDYVFEGCATSLNESDVWYEIPLTMDETIITVDITGFTGAGNYGAAAYFTNSDCGALQPVVVEGAPVEDCSGDKSLEIPVKCIMPFPSSIYIKVGSPADDNDTGNGLEQGEFSISVSNVSPSCEYADECEEINAVMMPVTDPDGVIIYTACESSCLEYACPQTNVSDCDFGTNPTVWFQVDTDVDAQQLYVTVTAEGSWDPVFAIYMGDCANLTLVPGGTVDAPINCNTDDTTPEVSNIGIQTDAMGNAISTYYIAVSADGIVDNPNFEICTATTIGTVACLGGIPPDYLNFTCDPQATFTVTGRSNDPDGSLGLPLDGPFCPGEVIDLNFAFFYDATATGNDWLQGIVPKFGEAVDMSNFDPMAITVTPAGAQWFMEGVPIVNENVPQLCTYTDANGVLQLCNPNCENCPCTGPLPAGSALPGGWFWVTNGGAGCANDGTPATMYGIPGGTQVNVEFDLQLTIKEFADMAECLDNADKLTFSLQTFSDGVTGCWEDPTAECLKDINQVINYPVECDLPPGVIANPNPVELCNEGTLNVVVQTEDGSNLEIIVTAEDNPAVDGENDYNFMGSGNITDQLTNTSGSVQTVLYIMQAIDPDIFCPGPKDTLIVTIYPELEVEFSDVFVCAGLCTDLTPDLIAGGTGVYTEYEWSTGENGVTTINVCPTVPTTYTLIVTDDLGCTGSGEVEVDVKPKVDVELIPSEVTYCIDGILGNDDPIVVTINDGSSPYNFFWESNPFGLDGNVTPGGTNVNGDTYQVEAENSNASFTGPYELCVEVFDLFGCGDTTCMDVSVLIAPIASFELESPLACGQTEVNLVADYDEANSFTGFDRFELFDCEGNFLESGGTDPYTFTGYDLEDNDCFILYSYNIEGCSDIDQIQLTITQGEPAVLSGDSTICSGSIANIEVVNGSTYTTWEWSNGDNTSMISVTPDTTTTYIVTVTENSGCTDVAAFEVVVNQAPTIEIAGSTTYCAGSSTTLMATSSSGSSYVWTDDSNTIVSNTSEVTISTPGNYTIMVTLNGCIADSTIFVNEESTLNINLNKPTLCDNGLDTLFAGNGFTTYTWSFNDSLIAGADTSFLEVSEEGSYSVTITDGGCSGADTVQIVNFPTPTAVVTDSIEVCRQMDAGNVVINFNDQVTGSSGVWSDTDLTGVDLSNLDSVSFEGIVRDTYSFTYTTNTAMGNCQNTSYVMEVIVISCPCPVVATRAIPNQCNNSGNFVLLNNYLSSPMVQVGFWSFVSGPQVLTISNDTLDISNVMAGAYVVQWNLGTPVGTCPDSSLQMINIFEAPYVEVDPSPKSLCNLDSGQGDFEVDLNTYLLAGSAPGTWMQTGGPTVDLTNLPIISGIGLTAGDIIQFTYTTNNAMAPCQNETAVVNILIRDCSCPFVTIDDLPFACNSGTTFNLDLYVTTDPAGLDGTWSINYTPSPLSGSVFDATGVPSGLYTVTFTLDDDPGAGCQSAFTQDLFVRRQPVAVVIGSGSPCNTNSTGLDITTVDLFDLLAPNPSNGTWTQTGGTPTLNIDPSGVVDFDGMNIGSVFEFTYTTNSAIDPCVNVSATVSVTVIDCECPNLDISPVGPLCNTDSEIDLSNLEGPAIGDGSWSVVGPSGNVPLNGTILTITDLQGGDYDLTYTLSTVPAGSCAPDTTQVLTIIEQVSATVLPDAQACSEDDGQNGNVIDLFANVTDGDMSGKWYFPNGDEILIPNFADFQQFNIGDIVTVTYIITGTMPCQDRMYQVNVEIIDCACTQIITTDFEACSTEGIIDLTPYGDQNLAGSFQSTDVTITGSSVDVSDLNGNYMIDYVLDNPEPNCPDRETLIMTIIKQFNSGVANNTSLCVDVNDVIDLFSLLDGEDSGGVWTETSSQPSTSGFDPNNGTFDTNGQAVGTFRFTYTFSNNSPCPDVSSEVTVTIQNKPPVDAGEAQTLDCTLLSAQIGGTPGNAAFDYEWTHNDGLVVPNSNNAQTMVDFPGIFTLTVTDKATGCTSTDQVTIDLSNDRPEADLAFEDISCFGAGDGSINIINVMGGLAPYQYSSNGGTTYQASPNFLNLEQGIYNMVISDAAGCIINLGSVEINEPPLLSIDLGEIQTVKLEETVNLSIENQFDPTNIASIVWTLTTDSGDSIICSGIQCLNYSYFAQESGTICVTVIDNNGCQADDCIIINVIKVRDITLPQIFTPTNGDNINNVFFVNDNDVESVDKFYIFDRWGNKVFSIENTPPNDPQFGWDGTFNGKDVEQGVYVYVIEITYVGGLNEKDTFSGDITVLR